MTSDSEITWTKHENKERDAVHANGAFPCERTPRSDAAAWRGQNFKGTLGLRMAQAAKVPNIWSFAGGQGSFRPVVGKQTPQKESLALNAPSAAAPELQTPNGKSFARNRLGLKAKLIDPASTRPNGAFRAAGLAMALAAIFAGGMLTQSLGSRTSEVSRKLDEQKRLLDDVAGKLALQEEKLFAREAETRERAEDFKRLIADERVSMKAEIARKLDEQQRLLDEVAGKLEVREATLLSQEVETQGRAEEFKRLVAQGQAKLMAEIERKIDEKIDGLREADEKKPSDGFSDKRQTKGREPAAATTESDRAPRSAQKVPDAAWATAAPIARPAAVSRPGVAPR